MPKDDLDLALRIQDMTPRTTLFKVLKQALGLRGYWKNRPRGNPAKGYKKMKEGGEIC